MSIEEKNNFEDDKSVEVQIEKRSKFIKFLKNNKAATVLSAVLLVLFIYFSIKFRISERIFINEKTQLINKYENSIDSMQIAQLEFSTKVFSWSVRSELLRNNTENLNQLLTVFVKESGADLVQIITPIDKMILLSSDKKFEGNPYTEKLDFELNESTVVKEESNVKIITPIMGFNNKIGILVIELKQH